MKNNLFKYRSLKWFLILNLIIAPTLVVQAQTNLRDSVEQSIRYIDTDLSKAESLLKVNKELLYQEPDSIIFDYYYFSGAILEYKNDTTLKKAELLLKAKDLMEKSLGINQAVYFEIINVIGENLFERGRIEEAKLIWEEGLIKGLRFISYTDYPIGQYIKSIRKNLSALYEEQGDIYLSTCLQVNQTKGSYEYGYDLWQKAFDIQSTNPAQGLKLLDEAKSIFLESGQEGEEMLGPLYRLYISTYAYLNNEKSSLDLIKKHRNLIIASSDYDSYIADLTELVSIFSLVHHDVLKAKPFYEIIKVDILEASEKEQQDFIEKEQGYLYLCNLQKQIDSLTVDIAQLPPERIEKYCDKSYELGRLYMKRNQYNRVIDILDECNMKLKVSNIHNVKLRWNILWALENSAFQLKKFSLCEKYIEEAINILRKNKSVIPNYKENLSKLYNTQSICLMNQNKLEKALALNKKVLQNFEAIYGKKSLDYSIALHNKGRIYQLKKDYKKARDIFRESLRISTSLNQKENPRTLQCLTEVEKILKAQL